MVSNGASRSCSSWLALQGSYVSSNAHNPLLDLVCSRLRRARPRVTAGPDFTTRIETVGGRPFVYLWFRTRGCRADARGECTMCNYGASAPVSTHQMVAAVTRGLSSIAGLGEVTLMVSPSGSMFDEWEVPAEAREAIFQLAKAAGVREIITETRAESLDDECVRGFASLFGHEQPGIGLGLESADPWILKYCLNKSMSLPSYSSAVEVLRHSGVNAITNVLLGSPFLTQAEAIDDAIHSVRWAFAQGAGLCCVFPSHVKRYTLASWLWERKLYSPPSLWSLAEVLGRLGSEVARTVTISWYKNYAVSGGEAGTCIDSACVSSPTTCPVCVDRVMALLDAYRNYRDFDVIEELGCVECDCRLRWRESLEQPATEPLTGRVGQAYETIARGVLGDAWWEARGAVAIADLLASVE
jgi:radical SAM enzyme (TIGR01210 family)